MTGKKRDTEAYLARLDAHVIKPDEYADIPELTDEWFEKADRHVAGKLVRRGRPRSENRKEAVSIRLSPEVLRHFRAEGPGWQTRIDQVLRDWISRTT